MEGPTLKDLLECMGKTVNSVCSNECLSINLGSNSVRSTTIVSDEMTKGKMNERKEKVIKAIEELYDTENKYYVVASVIEKLLFEDNEDDEDVSLNTFEESLLMNFLIRNATTKEKATYLKLYFEMFNYRDGEDVYITKPERNELLNTIEILSEMYITECKLNKKSKTKREDSMQEKQRIEIATKLLANKVKI